MELKQRDMLREIYRSNLILHGCKTYNLYITGLVPRDSKVKQILSSDWLPERERACLVRWKFPAQPCSHYPGPKGFSWNFSSRKRERAAKRRQRVAKRRRVREKRFLSLLAASRFALGKTKKNFKKNLWDQGTFPGSSPTRKRTKERGSFSAFVPEENVLSALQ